MKNQKDFHNFTFSNFQFTFYNYSEAVYSTVTLFARFLGWSTSAPRSTAIWYARSWSGMDMRMGMRSWLVGGTGTAWSANLSDLGVALGHEGDHHPAPGLHLLDVGEDLLVHAVLSREDDNGHVLVDKSDGAVLHLARGIAFGVDIGNLLELERAFERNGIVGPLPR